MKIPQDVVDHCDKHKLCKGCPLGTCVAPLVGITDQRWNAWLAERIAAVRNIGEGQ